VSDRFEDLGAGNGRSPGERLAERDRTHPEPVKGPPEVPRPGNKYAWAVGIVALMGLGVLLFTTTLPNTGEGLEGPKAGTTLRVFASPSATGDVEGDPNVCQRKGCPEQQGRIPACDVPPVPGVVNLCRLRKRPLVMTFVFDRGADCLPQVDRTERVMRKLRGVQFVTVFFSKKKRDELSEIVRNRGWKQPVAVDDGALVNMYGVGGCPTTVFARPGGKVVTTKLGNVTEGELRSTASRLQ
jgi:hypothetical protein